MCARRLNRGALHPAIKEPLTILLEHVVSVSPISRRHRQATASSHSRRALPALATDDREAGRNAGVIGSGEHPFLLSPLQSVSRPDSLNDRSRPSS